MLDPTKASLDAEYALRARLVDEVVYYYGVCRVGSTVGNVCFVVLKHFVLLDVGAG